MKEYLKYSSFNSDFIQGDMDPSKFQKIYLRQMSRRKRKPNYPSYLLSEEDRVIIRQFHSAPFAWYVSETLKYIMRPQEQFQYVLNENLAPLKSLRPMVG
jgi:hypothetical protein